MPIDLERLKAALGNRYAVERELGSGGMATVYLATDLRHQRHVALKVLNPEIAASVGRERFLREIGLAANLQHPHILPLHDSGEADGFYFYVMPYIDGDSLRSRIVRSGELPIPEAMRILTEVVDALAYAHSLGVVHRDIKPDNVLLSGKHALVADFGLARALTRASDASSITGEGMALGTPAYMAPEQVVADPHVDHRADIYAVGMTAYEMLTGYPAFTGRSQQEVLAAHVSQAAASISSHRPAVPAALDAVIMKCLEKRPADRWQRSDELLARLEELDSTILEGTHSSARLPASAPAPVRSGRRWAFLAGAVVTTGVLALVAAQLFLIDSHALELGRRSQVTLDPGLEIYPSLSPHGDLVAYTGGPETRLFVRQVGGGNIIEVAPAAVAGPQIMPHWSPDGTQLSFTSIRGVEVVPALGGQSNVLIGVSPGELIFGGSWSPDGKRIAVVRSDTLFLAPVGGQAPQPLHVAPELHSCAWSPDGARIACVSGNMAVVLPGASLGNMAQSRIVVIRTETGQAAFAVENNFTNLSPAWLPDGTLLFISNQDGGRDVYALTLNASNRSVGPSRRLTTGLGALSITTALSRNWLGYATFSETSNIWTMEVPAAGETASISTATAVTRGNQIIESFDLSPDRRWLVFDSDRSGNSDLYRMSRTGGEPQQLTHTAADEFWPRWSPDGSAIAFHSFLQGRQRQVLTIPAAGGAANPVIQTNHDDRTPDWRPDGRGLLLLTDYLTPSAENRLVERDANGAWGVPQPWRKPGCSGTHWSPDGRYVACSTSDGVLLLNPTGDSLRLIAPAHQHAWVGFNAPSWSDDSRTVYFIDTDSVGTAIFSVSVDGSAERAVVRFDDPSRPWHRYGFLISGDQFYFTVGDRQSDVWVASVERKE